MAAITTAEVLRAAQRQFELRIAQSLRNHSARSGADAARRDSVIRYEAWMKLYDLKWIDPTIPKQCEEWCAKYAIWTQTR